MRKPRTKVKWGNHKLKVYTRSGFDPKGKVLTWELKIPHTIRQMVKFTRLDDILIVTGDFGTWTFNRDFEPTPGGYVSDSYWIEKMDNQKAMVFNSDYIRKELKIWKRDVKNCFSDKQEIREMQDYYDECIRCCEDETDYWHAARNVPNGDYEYIIDPNTTHKYLLCIFDAFERVCVLLEREEVKKLNHQLLKFTPSETIF